MTCFIPCRRNWSSPKRINQHTCPPSSSPVSCICLRVVVLRMRERPASCSCGGWPFPLRSSIFPYSVSPICITNILLFPFLTCLQSSAPLIKNSFVFPAGYHFISTLLLYKTQKCFIWFLSLCNDCFSFPLKLLIRHSPLPFHRNVASDFMLNHERIFVFWLKKFTFFQNDFFFKLKRWRLCYLSLIVVCWFLLSISLISSPKLMEAPHSGTSTPARDSKHSK